MSQPRNRTSNRGYQLTAEAAAYLAENRRPYRLTPKAVEVLNDHKASFIASDENLPRPTADKSHRQESETDDYL